MKTKRNAWAWDFFASALAMLAALNVQSAQGVPLPNYDRRSGNTQVTAEQTASVAAIGAQVSNAQIEFNPITGSAKWVRSEMGFLSGPNGEGGGISLASAAKESNTDPNRALKAFLNDHSRLFKHGAEILKFSQIKREFTSAHNGLRTVVWEQELDGIPVFEGLLTAHVTKQGELVSITSGFMPDHEKAADRGTPKRDALEIQPMVTAKRAMVLSAKEAGEIVDEKQVVAVQFQPEGAAKKQQFQAPGLNGETDVQFVWLPIDGTSMRLCWSVTLTSRSRAEMYRVLIDVQTGESLLRHCLTSYISDATYRVFTSDSPSPFSPGYSTPTSSQPPLVSRSLVTLPALNTNASPNGWIDDGVNETRGNNVDAHTDLNNDNQPDLPRPQGSPFRVFDFPLDLTQSPATYRSAAVVQLFYWNNWMHDRLYDLGFTEAAGNFQNNNFGRGGLANDAVQADAQDGGGYNNANFSTPPDGSPGRMQMYVFNYPSPARDGDFDAEVVLHEYTHGLSNRRVGGGVGISALQTGGMGEGWSDFYGLTLLSEAGDDVNGVYAAGAYVTYQLGGLTQNYYYGIRRYPYCTDMNKNPLTFKDIDPSRASTHPGIPRSPIIGTQADEVHNMGEVWCVTLWEARARMINKYGWATGNQLILQLVTDGMNLSPANPNFLQARDAILQADMVDTGGANRTELWAAFAKRGMGASATSPSSSTATGVLEAYDVPDALLISPVSQQASGPVGGPFTPNSLSFVLTNSGTGTLTWSLATTSSWITASITNGTLNAGGAATSVNLTIKDVATNFPLGGYTSLVLFSNQTSGVVQARTLALYVVGRNLFDSFDPNINLSLWSSFGGTLGSTVLANNYGGSVSPPNSLWFGDGGSRFATTIPINTSSGGSISFYLRLANGSAWPWENVDLPGEGVVLEYSANAGSTWTIAGTYNTAGYFNWTNVTLAIPAGAQGPAVQFRWRQLSNSGSDYDHWALDNVSIDAGPLAPTMSSQPQDQHVFVGDDVFFTVGAWGTQPLSYQWRINGTNIGGATGSSLLLTNVQLNAAGGYSVSLSNSVGTNLTATANLTVSPTPPCTPPPAALISWWRGQGNASDTLGAHDGTPVGGVTFQQGRAGQGFSLNGVDGEVDLGNWFSYQVFSVALWVKANASQVSSADIIDNNHTDFRSWVVQYNNTGLDFFWYCGNFGKIPFTLTPNAWQFLVVTIDASHVARVFLDGQLQGSIAGANGITYDGTQFLRLGRWGSGGRYFNGMVDEVDVYARALSLTEITNLYSAGPAGKCLSPVPPFVAGQPSDRVVASGGGATFSAIISGTPPLSYQWLFNGAPLANETNAALALANVTTNQAGTYAIQVTNIAGAALSSNALLTVLYFESNCVPAPTGLISWWRGEADALDQVGGNHGTLVGNTSYGTAEVGLGFVLDGNTDGVQVANDVNLQVQEFTIEGWIKRANSSVATSDSSQEGLIFGYGSQGYGLGVDSAGRALLTQVDVQTVKTPSIITDTNFHHLAVTRMGTNVVFYLDGTAYSVPPFGPTFTFSTTPAVGARGDNMRNSFLGVVDEVSVYNRALTPLEIEYIYVVGSGGKCSPVVPPFITAQPTSQSVYEGATVSFNVLAGGSSPLRYQWLFNGSAITNATNSTLLLPTVTLGQAGPYAVVVSNQAGVIQSSDAVLTVNPIPPCVPPAPGLASWWQAEGNVNDTVGGKTGTLSGGVSYQPGQVGQAFSLNGVNGEVDLGNWFDYQIFSVALWVKANGSQITSADIIDNNHTDFRSWVVQYNNTGLDFFWYCGDFGKIPFTLTPNQWQFLVVTLDANHVAKVYLDGQLQGQIAGSHGITYDGTQFLRLGRWGSGGRYFNGLLDEVDVYGRDLSPSEIADLYNAGGGGKCIVPVSPYIISQPTNQTVNIGGSANFGITVVGSMPFSYQWLFNNTPIPGQTNAFLAFSNLQSTNAGDYSVQVTNVAGAILSSSASLAVLSPQTNCAPVPSGIVGWWRAEGNTLDQIGGNPGTLADNVSYGAGKVGYGFALDGNGDGVILANTVDLQVQDFTIEAWIKRASASITTSDSSQEGLVFGYGSQGYGLGVDSSGRPLLTQVDVDTVKGPSLITDTNQHHLAVTKSGNNVIFFVDGLPYQVAAFGPIFAFSTTPAIGARGDNLRNSFLGTVDDLSIYSRALSATEIQSIYTAGTFGKCAPAVPPFLLSQPTNQTVLAGGSVSFTVIAGGTPPLSFQWLFNGAALTNATNAALALSGLTTNQTGAYAVVVSNQVGSVQSSDAQLTVIIAPPCAPPPLGLLSWWRGEANANDSVGGHTGTLSGGVAFQTGQVGQGFALNGVDASVDLGSWFNLQAFTVALWVKANASQVTSADIIDNNHTQFRSWVVQYNNTGLQFFWYCSDFGSIPFNLTPNTWQYLVITVDPSFVASVYLDGQLQGSIAGTHGITYDGSQFLRLGRWGSGGRNFNGMVDEADVYGRALSLTDITNLYAAGMSGKCVTPVAPFVMTQPTNQTVSVGGSANFAITSAGSVPFRYQWSFNGSPLSNATNSTLLLANVQGSNSGNYSLLVSNIAGTAQSSNAVLTVLIPQTNCTTPPNGLVAWWSGETNAFDQAGTNHGALAGNTTYGLGKVGAGFILDGNGDGVRVANATNLRLQDFTIEAWIKRGSASIVSSGSTEALIFSYGNSGYGLGVDSTGRPLLTQVDVNTVKGSPVIVDTTFHHIAVAKNGANVTFFVDGTPYSAAAFNPTFTFSTPPAIGARGDTLGNSFLGTVDEISVYNRALATAEVQSIYTAGSLGKCPLPIAPFIVGQPTNQTVLAGGSTTFAVTVGGSPPLTYRWMFKGSFLTNATNAVLNLTGITTNQAGAYAVLITNSYGAALSSNATLTVNVPPGCTNAPSGIVSWWRAENNALDTIGTNHGTLAGNTTYGLGLVGLGFVMDGTTDGVRVGNPTNLQLQSFSIEAWVKRASTTKVTGTAGNNAVVFSYGSSGYGFGLSGSGQPLLSRIDIDQVVAGPTIIDTNLHHLAMTKSGPTVIFYVDGTGTSAPAYSNTFNFTTVAAVGARGDTLGNSFLGTIDELSLYNRALSGSEIQAIYNAGSGGKCLPDQPPTATNTTAFTGQNHPLNISTTKLLLSASDPDGDPLTVSGVSANSTNGGPVTLSVGVVTYVPVNGFVGADRFTYTVSDGRGGSGSAFVFVQVIASNQIAGTLTRPAHITGGYSISVSGAQGLTYSLQRSTNVIGPWDTLTGITIGAGGIGSYADTNPPAPKAFYRTVYP